MRKKITGIIFLVLILIFALISYIIYNTFHYKTYYDYTFLLVKNGKKYKMNTFNLVGDVYKKEYYITLVRKDNETVYLYSAYDLENLINIDTENYIIDDSDSKFYDGIIVFDRNNDNVSEKVSTDEITINKSIERREIEIDYKNSVLHLSSSFDLPDEKLKKTKSILMSSRNGRTYRMSYFGLPFSELNEKFSLGLKIKTDDKNKVVYFIKDTKQIK